MKLQSAMSAFLFASLVALGGCAATDRTTLQTNVVSSADDEKGRWVTIEDFRKDFKAIVPGKTTLEDLDSLGFGPNSQNVEKLGAFSSVKGVAELVNYMRDLLPQPIVDCFETQGNCNTLVFSFERIESRGKEDLFDRVVLDKKVDEKTGWRASGMIFFLVSDNVVVYAESDETPNVVEVTKSKDPLHLLRSLLSGALTSAGSMIF